MGTNLRKSRFGDWNAGSLKFAGRRERYELNINTIRQKLPEHLASYLKIYTRALCRKNAVQLTSTTDIRRVLNQFTPADDLFLDSAEAEDLPIVVIEDSDSESEIELQEMPPVNSDLEDTLPEEHEPVIEGVARRVQFAAIPTTIHNPVSTALPVPVNSTVSIAVDDMTAIETSLVSAAKESQVFATTTTNKPCSYCGRTSAEGCTGSRMKQSCLFFDASLDSNAIRRRSALLKKIRANAQQ